MPSSLEVQQYFIGVWRMMMGREDGMKLLDLSADGFWNSFFAIVVALPPMIVAWVGAANGIAGLDTFGTRLSLVSRLFVADIGAWLLPLGMLALVSRMAGIADRFVQYVVSSNWASALFAWVMLPPALLRLFAPFAEGLAAFLSLLLFAATLFLFWRLTVVVIAKGVAVGSAVFFGMLVASIAALLVLQGILGLGYQ
ncbi:transporter [Chelativorans sp. YIM 93263]|uniref:transporter n=1 Tax=Chelativorans sp. YIM 93263 TaxID=2906648 RepID=UPI002378E040|nr:transporter [Chelativorans sp. YIM 93263]